MKVRVKLFATLAGRAPESVRRATPDWRAGRAFDWELPAGSTLHDLVDALALPHAEVKQVFVNGRARPLDHSLAEGDEIGIFPPIGGG
jgi:molybdopterin converting factor small subunit